MSLTLVNFSCVSHEVSQFAMRKTAENVPMTKALFFSNKKPLLYKSEFDFHKIEPPNIINIEEQQRAFITNYVHFFIKEINNFIDTEFMLIVQHDGMATKKEFWTDEFLEYDYIGAPSMLNSPVITSSGYYHKKYNLDPNKKGWYNGNGGFSLRSKKLLKAIASDDRIPVHIDMVAHQTGISYNLPVDDGVICIICRDILEKDHGIKFAPVELAMQFACDEMRTPLCLGFHGLQNMPLFLNDKECLYILKNIEHRHMGKNWDVYGTLMGNLYAAAHQESFIYCEENIGPFFNWNKNILNGAEGANKKSVRNLRWKS